MTALRVRLGVCQFNDVMNVRQISYRYVYHLFTKYSDNFMFKNVKQREAKTISTFYAVIRRQDEKPRINFKGCSEHLLFNPATSSLILVSNGIVK